MFDKVIREIICCSFCCLTWYTVWVKKSSRPKTVRYFHLWWTCV